MRIISWDVGVIHLAYCILEYIENGTDKIINIIDWDEINLIEDDRIKLKCCGIKKGDEKCNKNASYYIHSDKYIGFCKTHLSQNNNFCGNKNTYDLFKKISTNNKCMYLTKDNTICGKNSKYIYTFNNEKKYLCNVHYKLELKKKLKTSLPQPIKNLMVKKFPTAILQLNLIKKLDTLIEHFSKLKIEEVIIENQPSIKNPKMKSIANTLFDYFMIRGYVDKIYNLNIKQIKFICPSNKLKINNNNTIEIFKANKNSKEKYKLTKQLSIIYTKQLLKNDPLQLEYLNLYTKQDDLCDAYLQGRYYLEFIKKRSE